MNRGFATAYLGDRDAAVAPTWRWGDRRGSAHRRGSFADWSQSASVGPCSA